jgi:hypothetical protein
VYAPRRSANEESQFDELGGADEAGVDQVDIDLIAGGFHSSQLVQQVRVQFGSSCLYGTARAPGVAGIVERGGCGVLGVEDLSAAR